MDEYGGQVIELRGDEALCVFTSARDALRGAVALLGGCRDLHILATSRIPLHLSREHEHAVPPLAVPDPQRVRDAATLSQYESVALFIQRAKAARDSFTISDENAPAVAEICSRLDGLPLAIELAAARIKLFPPQALLQRLDSRLKLLTGGARDRPTRQQTLRGAVDWSYVLPTEAEQALFARLSVFAGGCTLDAVEAVCNASGDLEMDTFDGVSSLVDKSLVRQIEDDASDEPRFALLETIREYAAEKLAERGEAEAVRDVHVRFFTDLVSRAQNTTPWIAVTVVQNSGARAVVNTRWAFEPRRFQLTYVALHGASGWQIDDTYCTGHPNTSIYRGPVKPCPAT